MKGVQCYELFGGIALKNHTFSFSFSNIYLCGDFNINLLNNDSNNQVNNLLDSIYSLGFSSLITKPTRITSQSATLIDNILTNIYDHAHMSGIIVCDISDHCPVFTCKKVINSKLKTKQEKKKYIYFFYLIDMYIKNINEI